MSDDCLSPNSLVGLSRETANFFPQSTYPLYSLQQTQNNAHYGVSGTSAQVAHSFFNGGNGGSSYISRFQGPNSSVGGYYFPQQPVNIQFADTMRYSQPRCMSYMECVMRPKPQSHFNGTIVQSIVTDHSREQETIVQTAQTLESENSTVNYEDLEKLPWSDFYVDNIEDIFPSGQSANSQEQHSHLRESTPAPSTPLFQDEPTPPPSPPAPQREATPPPSPPAPQREATPPPSPPAPQREATPPPRHKTTKRKKTTEEILERRKEKLKEKRRKKIEQRRLEHHQTRQQEPPQCSLDGEVIDLTCDAELDEFYKKAFNEHESEFFDDN